MHINYPDFWHQLAPIYGEREAKAITELVYERRYGLSRVDLIMGHDKEVPHDELRQLLERLTHHEPVQYVLGEAEFCGRLFHVEPGVLIPRPETEELCRLILHAPPSTSPPSRTTLLDIGTGSGCIAITLALELADCHVTAWDISPDALRIAHDNARRLEAEVNFVHHDILRQSFQVAPQWDIIVSNPPYICESEAADMAPNVLDYEPAMALFVPDDDPLQFYRPIMNYAQSALHPGGHLYLETNPLYEEFIEDNLLELGFDTVEAVDDQYGKTRFIDAQR